MCLSGFSSPPQTIHSYTAVKGVCRAFERHAGRDLVDVCAVLRLFGRHEEWVDHPGD